MRGCYVVFEGIVGTGKSTMTKRLVEYLKQNLKDQEIIWTREPGGTEIAETIRKIVQGTLFEEEMDPICEAYLYASSRAQSLRSIVQPVLERGGIVISDRSYLTSVAFQGAGRNLGYETILRINKEAVNNLEPDIIIYLDVLPSIGLSRTNDHKGDKFEKEGTEFFFRAREGYKFLEEKYNDKWFRIDATKSEDEVFKEVLSTYIKQVSKFFRQQTLFPFTPKEPEKD